MEQKINGNISGIRDVLLDEMKTLYDMDQSAGTFASRELLEATEMRSVQIAEEVGYNDSHYFSYLFKKTTGMTPGEYRKASRESKNNEP